MRWLSSSLSGIVVLSFARMALAQTNLTIVDQKLDRPTVISLGVQVLVSGDANRNATVSVRYRSEGSSAWLDGLPLFHVRPSVVVGATVPEQFAGSLFELLPATTYEIELHAQDPDGLDQTLTLSGTTRAVPGDPALPNAVSVNDAASLSSALNAAQAGDVITLSNGTYSGQFSIQASGTAQNPVVIRGASADGAIIDGGACTGCNALEVYGSFVHVESLTIQNAERGMRFQGSGAEGNAVRRVMIKNVRLGIGSKDGQKDFYICDNVLEGRLSWPSVYGDDAGAHANDDGINLTGDGHVICHNSLKGFGDSIKNEAVTFRSFDVYGNDSLSAYDNAVELDGNEGNARCFRNRLTNSWSPLSFQPIFGGPAYAFRNVVVNVVDEQQKLHSLGGNQETVGAFLANNTFVSAEHAINLQAAATAHDFTLVNNIYFGPDTPLAGKTVDWSVPIDNGTLDPNGYYPDGMFDFGGANKWANFSAMQSAGVFEANGVLLTQLTFATGLAAPTTYSGLVAPPDVALASGSLAIDRGQILLGITDGFMGSAPDLGALESGCATPIYGPRPDGVDETNEPRGCTSSGGSAGTGGTGGSAAGGAAGASAGGSSNGGSGGTGSGGKSSGSSDDSGGCGCRAAGASSSAANLLWSVVAAGLGIALRRKRQNRTS